MSTATYDAHTALLSSPTTARTCGDHTLSVLNVYVLPTTARPRSVPTPVLADRLAQLPARRLFRSHDRPAPCIEYHRVAYGAYGEERSLETGALVCPGLVSLMMVWSDRRLVLTDHGMTSRLVCIVLA